MKHDELDEDDQVMPSMALLLLKIETAVQATACLVVGGETFHSRHELDFSPFV